MARLRTNSAFQRLTAAYASNEMGVTLALPGPATNAGLVTALATTASTVAGIMSGAIADRSNPSFLLRLSFGLEFLLWGLLGLLLWQGTANVAIIQREVDIGLRIIVYHKVSPSVASVLRKCWSAS